jgi:hypothetical protein
MGLATFWAILSQTHPVTLAAPLSLPPWQSVYESLQFSLYVNVGNRLTGLFRVQTLTCCRPAG